MTEIKWHRTEDDELARFFSKLGPRHQDVEPKPGVEVLLAVPSYFSGFAISWWTEISAPPLDKPKTND